MNSGETSNGSAPNGQSSRDPGAYLEAQTSDLLMCLQRLARLQQTPIDILDLREAIGRLDKGDLTPRRLKKGISALTKRLGSPEADWVKRPEPSNMPLLTWSAAEGFSVLRGQNAVGQWVLEAWIPDEQVWLERVVDDLEGAVYAKISLAKVFQASQSPVFELIRNEVFSHKKILTEIILAGFVVNTVALATSFYTMLVYDRVVPTGALSTLWVLTIGAAISVLYELITKVVRHRLYNRLINVVDQRLARSTFMQFLSVRLDQLPPSVGSFASQLRGYETVRNFLSSATSHVFVDVPFALLYAAIIGAIAGPLALIPLGVFVLCLAIGLSYKKQVEALTNSVDRAVNLKTGLLVEAVEGAETIKSGQGGWRLLSRWMQTTDDARVHEMRHRDISEQSKLLLGSLQQVSYVGIIFFGAQLASAGELTLGALIACSILSGRILAPVVMVPGLLIQWGQSKAALRGLDALWALQNDHDGQQPIAPDRVQGNFTFENVSASYRDNLALQIPALNVRNGEKIAILGPVGAGKTTLLRLLSGMYKPQEGRVLLDGIDLGQLSKPVLAENVGFVQQDGRLFSGTLRENLTLGLLDPGDAVLLDVAKRTGLLQMVITPHPKGLMQEINEDLYENRDVSILDVMDSKARVADAQNEVLDAKNEYLREALEESAKLETDLAMAQQQAKELVDVFSHTDVRAPVAGVVKYLKINTLGGVMRPGDELMQISPTESELLVEVRVKPMDVGQLELGLPVDISLDAFDSTIYGKLSGELIYLSSDTLTEQGDDGSTTTYYRARVRVDREAKAADPKFADLELRPGMTATVDIRTAKRTVLQFIAKPILRAFSGALTQR